MEGKLFSDGCRRDGRGMKGLGGKLGRCHEVRGSHLLFVCLWRIDGASPEYRGVDRSSSKKGPKTEPPQCPDPDQTPITSPICPLRFSLLPSCLSNPSLCKDSRGYWDFGCSAHRLFIPCCLLNAMEVNIIWRRRGRAGGGGGRRVMFGLTLFPNTYFPVFRCPCVRVQAGALHGFEEFLFSSQTSHGIQRGSGNGVSS